MKKYRIAVIPGDGIGKEVMPEGVRALDAVARKDAGVLLRKVIVPRSCRPGRDCEVTWWQRIDQAIGDV